MGYNLKSIKQDFKDKGIYYTPPELAEMMKGYIPFKPSNVYDPTCGDGSLLSVFDDDVEKYGQEINAHQLEVAKNRLINFTGYCGDTLKDPHFMDKRFEFIIANPPFSIKWEPRKDERFENVPVLPPPSKADYAFILHMLHLLKDDGVIVTLGFPGILYRGGREGKIRQWLVENNYIERVVLVPENTFVDTNISTVILVMRKNKTTTDIIFENKALNKERRVAIDEVVKNDYNLSVSTYVFEEVEKEKTDPYELEMMARRNTINKLRQDLNFSKIVCEMEGFDFCEYLEELKKVIEEFEPVGYQFKLF